MAGPGDKPAPLGSVDMPCEPNLNLQSTTQSSAICFAQTRMIAPTRGPRVPRADWPFLSHPPTRFSRPLGRIILYPTIANVCNDGPESVSNSPRSLISPIDSKLLKRCFSGVMLAQISLFFSHHTPSSHTTTPFRRFSVYHTHPQSFVGLFSF